MSAEDKKWLEEAMKQYTFDDADRLKIICDKLKEDLNSGFTVIVPPPSKEQAGANVNYDATVDLLEELHEISELHERNNLNLALCGGLYSVLMFILKHPDAVVRRVACGVFSAVV